MSSESVFICGGAAVLVSGRRQGCGTRPPAVGSVLLPGTRASLPAMSAGVLGRNLPKESHAVAL